jgi:hypothetical protein
MYPQQDNCCGLTHSNFRRQKWGLFQLTESFSLTKCVAAEGKNSETLQIPDLVGDPGSLTTPKAFLEGSFKQAHELTFLISESEAQSWVKQQERRAGLG